MPEVQQHKGRQQRQAHAQPPVSHILDWSGGLALTYHSTGGVCNDTSKTVPTAQPQP